MTHGPSAKYGPNAAATEPNLAPRCRAQASTEAYYVAAQAGVHTLPDGRVFEAGQVETMSVPLACTIPFDIDLKKICMAACLCFYASATCAIIEVIPLIL